MSETTDRIVLLLRCADRPGIVAAVAEFLQRQGANIVHADQHTDRSHDLFLQRVEVEFPEGAPDGYELSEALRPLAERFAMTWSIHATTRRPRVALLVSKDGHCLTDLLNRVELGELDAEIALVASNHDTLRPLVERAGIAFHHLPIDAEAGGKAAQETAMDQLLVEHDIELVVLARYMQILTDAFTQRWAGRVINIHHSFLPAFKGARPYHRAHERGVKIIGATAHYATADLDEGPIIVQDVTPVSHRDEVADLVRKGRDLERTVLASAVRLHLEHRVLAYENRTVVFD
ncbi:MAG: formyltetrahydrofolate deformylase [Actinomycetota bacterium]